MTFKTEILDTAKWYRTLQMARISPNESVNEPAFRGRLMDDKSGAGHGAGTLLMFDWFETPTKAVMYAPEACVVPFILERAARNGGLAFVLVKCGFRVHVITELRSLLRGECVVFNDDKGISREFGQWDFLPVVLRKYGIKPIFNSSL